MSKIVCDICGTSYDDAKGACPVCGWSQNGELPAEGADFDAEFLDTIQENAEPAAAAAEEAPKAKAALDQAALKRRSNPAKPAKPVKPAKPEPKKPDEDEDEDEDDEEEEESGSNAFLVIILVLLILALLAVSAYIGWVKILKPKQMGSENNAPKETIIAEVMDPVETTGGVVVDVPEVEEPAVSAVPCTNISLSGSVDTLFIGQYWRLMAKATPENTTDKIVYASSNDAVVSIDEYGRVTAVGAGEAVITITCGSQHLETTVVVKSSETDVTKATTQPATNPTAATAATQPANANNNTAGGNTAVSTSGFELGKHDITFTKWGTYYTMPIKGGISAQDIKWRTSDSSIANVNNGVITCTGRGVCIVTAEYDGKTEQCVVRCSY